MNLWPDLLRFGRLALLLCLVPLVRSCDDASGLAQTSGFPLPYAHHVNIGLQFSDMDWTFIALDALFFLALAVLLAVRLPELLRRLGSLRVFLVVTACGVFNAFFGWLVFFPLVVIAVLVNEVVPIELGPFMDVLSRLLLLGIVALALPRPTLRTPDA